MVVLTENNHVILGPMIYKKIRFENVLLEEHQVQASLPRNLNGPYTVNEIFKIYPVVEKPSPPYNPDIEHLQGPYYEYTDDHAFMSYKVEKLPLDFCKQRMKEKVPAIRYGREVSGVKATIQGIEVTIDTSRENRPNITQKYFLMADDETLSWKFPEGWFTLTKKDIETCITAATKHIQDQFDWEAATLTKIDNCSTYEDLLQAIQ